MARSAPDAAALLCAALAVSARARAAGGGAAREGARAAAAVAMQDARRWAADFARAVRLLYDAHGAEGARDGEGEGGERRGWHVVVARGA